MERRAVFFETIKTLAVVVGVGLAVWELVVKDRAATRLRSETTLDLIKLDFDSTIVASKRDFLKASQSLSDPTGAVLTPNEAHALVGILQPQVQYFIAWESCFATGLCDQEMGLQYACTRAVAIEATYELIYTALQSRRFANTNISDLTERCRAAFPERLTTQMQEPFLQGGQ